MVMSFYRAFPVFSTVFAVLYLLVATFNYALFTYHPVLREFDLLAQPAKAGPAMYWYGWISTAAIGALVATVIASFFFPIRWTQGVWSGWTAVIPLSVMLVFVYLLRGWFIPSVGLILK